MSLENPTSILVDTNGQQVGTPTNVLYVSGSSVVTGSVSISGPTTVTANIGTVGTLALDTSVQAISAKLGTLGQQTMAGSTPVVIASNQTPISVTGSFAVTSAVSTTASTFSISSSATAVTVLASNSVRLGGIFVNDSPSMAFIRFGAGATSNNWTYRMFPYATIELNQPTFTGVMSAVWAVATGSMRVTELA